MKVKKEKVEITASTEEKIKEAARVMFTKKGYAATKTRDIAEEAGLNLALLNYYFRSKEKLFELIMTENLQKLFAFLVPVLNDNSTSLNEKLDVICDSYLDMLSANPDLPLFVLSEIRKDPVRFGKTIQLEKSVLKSNFMQQIAAKKKDIHPVQFLISFMGMLVFPFISRPVFESTGAFGDEIFAKLIEERKKLIPQWMKLMLK